MTHLHKLGAAIVGVLLLTAWLGAQATITRAGEQIRQRVSGSVNWFIDNNSALANFFLGDINPAIVTNSASLGHDNLFIGLHSGVAVTDGVGNLGIGHSALASLTTGVNNLAIGWDSQFVNLTGQDNVSLGEDALKFITGDNNTSVGYASSYSIAGAHDNAALGVNAMHENVTGNYNTALGARALNAGGAGTNGDANVAVGYQTLVSSTGNTNTAVGMQAGWTQTTGTGNVFLGNRAGFYETGSNTLIIDNAVRSNEADARVKALVYGIFNAAVASQSITINGALSVARAITSLAGAGTQTVHHPGVLFWENTNASNAADTNFVKTTSYTIPANTLTTNGDQVQVEWQLTLSAAVSTRTYVCNVGFSAWTAAGGFTGGVNLLSNGTSTGSTTLLVDATMTRTGSAAESYFSTSLSTAAGTFQNQAYTTASSIDWTAAQSVACEVKDGSSNAASATMREIRITYRPY